MFYSILFASLIFSNYNFDLVHSAEIKPNFNFLPSRIELDINITLGSGEKLNNVAISKDEQIFLQYTAGQENSKNS